MSEARAVPLLGDISLEYVQRIEHSLDGGFAPTRIAALPGELQQRTGRPSHRVRIVGVLFGEKAADDLKAVQAAAAAGEELTFASDITTALDLQKVVITRFRADEVAGQPGRFRYEIHLAESPPLPPPAQLEAFGGLGDFGVGDLGFDTDMLGDLTDMAGDLAGAIDGALDVMDTLSGLADQLGALASLANLGDLDATGFLGPMNDTVSKVGGLADTFKGATKGLTDVFNS